MNETIELLHGHRSDRDFTGEPIPEDQPGFADAGQWPAGYPEADRTAYDLATIKGWLTVFLRRFFSNQFKRTAMPNGPKVLAGGSLSPRGDWRMPSDASAKAWIDELEARVSLG